MSYSINTPTNTHKNTIIIAECNTVGLGWAGAGLVASFPVLAQRQRKKSLAHTIFTLGNWEFGYFCTPCYTVISLYIIMTSCWEIITTLSVTLLVITTILYHPQSISSLNSIF